MEIGVWLSYDLGIKGDYQNLYAWLDDQNAIECGNSIAYFKFNATSYASIEKDIQKSLKSKITFNLGDRIYIVSKREIGEEIRTIGRFIIGKRKSNPWEGFGSKSDAKIEGDE